MYRVPWYDHFPIKKLPWQTPSQLAFKESHLLFPYWSTLAKSAHFKDLLLFQVSYYVITFSVIIKKLFTHSHSGLVESQISFESSYYWILSFFQVFENYCTHFPTSPITVYTSSKTSLRRIQQLTQKWVHCKYTWHNDTLTVNFLLSMNKLYIRKRGSYCCSFLLNYSDWRLKIDSYPQITANIVKLLRIEEIV